MVFSDLYVTRAFSIATINTIGLCAGVVELSEALDSRPGGTSNPSSNPVRNILLLFLFVRDEYKYFYLSGIPLNKICIIRREYKTKDLFRSEVATNLQLNWKFRPLFIK